MWASSESFLILVRLLNYCLQPLDDKVEVLDLLLALGGREAQNTLLCSLILPQPVEDRHTHTGLSVTHAHYSGDFNDVLQAF